MYQKIQEYKESNKTIKMVEIGMMILLLLSSIFSFCYANNKVHENYGELLTCLGEVVLYRDKDNEDFDENYTICDVVYQKDEDRLVVSYLYEEYLHLTDSLIAYKYQTENNITLLFDHFSPSVDEIKDAYQELLTNRFAPVYNLSISLFILAISLGVIYFFSKSFTLYEKIWFISIMVLATIFSYFFPEEEANGVSGIIIMLLYLLDTFFNILCELLISKQSRYNFLVSILVEITEILICFILMYRFATMATTLFFWLPIDIISFINWSKHKDEQEEELTVVRHLKGYQEVLVVVGIIVWTLLAGYVLSGLDIQTGFIKNANLKTLIIYLDACASAVGVCNGLFIFFRLKEQWLAWYLCALLESIINILSGQYVLLVLKLGYFTNTTYGYIKWSRYIKTHKDEKITLF